jgi:hypothetical protein
MSSQGLTVSPYSYTIRHTSEWYNSPVAVPTDASLAAYAELQRILSRSLEFLYSGTDSPSGLQVHCDYLLVIKNFETQLAAWKYQWVDSASWPGKFLVSLPSLAVNGRTLMGWSTILKARRHRRRSTRR